MKRAIATLMGGLMASEAFVLPAAVSRGLAAAGSSSREVVSCSASTSSSSSSSSSSQGGGQNNRVAFLHKAGLAAATTVAAVTGSPLLARAEEEDEVKVGEEVTTDSGLKYTVTVAGKGSKPSPGNMVKAHYTGWLNAFGDEDGAKFDSSRDRGRPFSFKVGTGQVIKAWDEAMLDMRIGERRQITVPPQLGYGSRGAGGVIPPNATLYFDVELLAVQP
ncbi:FKBP-type peptidyl-prolyl cis-trans isomerase 2 [Ectocarpus siliculosus]|uniref:peptidylprolyl isomerase n=1 Tax=Ectocarpus siliculosus TaxID=2880 RepID=D7FVA7_ECTSI|nr:FKBP-type peptidyl-prolyl cis-trans isomerase 2 [Ectocarpus siliculosus]|eukprot:CBJ26279.1 FKBP-type peptidyl-prolyl cis-trans isomerase 2 [Ectocarpus siliculosus]